MPMQYDIRLYSMGIVRRLFLSDYRRYYIKVIAEHRQSVKTCYKAITCDSKPMYIMLDKTK